MTGRSFNIDALAAKLRQRLCDTPAAAWLPLDDLVQEGLAHLHASGWLHGGFPDHVLVHRAARLAEEAAFQAKGWHERHVLFTDIFTDRRVL